MKRSRHSAVKRGLGELLTLVKMPELVSLHPTVRGVEFDVEVEAYVAEALADIAGREGMSLDELCTEIHLRYTPGLPLAAGVRAFTLNYFRNLSVC